MTITNHDVRELEMRLELSELASSKANDDATALRKQNGDLLKVTPFVYFYLLTRQYWDS